MFNYRSTELQISKPLSLKAAIVMSVNELSALILFGGFKLLQCGILYALLLRTKIKHCFWNEILFIRDIKSFNGDGNFIFILYSSTSPASWCLSSFFSFFFFLSRVQTCWLLLRGSFERSFCIISLLDFVVAFSYTRFCGVKE